MKKNTFWIILILAQLLLISCKPSTDEKKNEHPNVVIIFTDDQGYQDLGCFGSPNIATPNIDAMAKKGLILRDFYVAQPVCSASRAGLLTGCYPNRVGVHNAYMPDSPVGLNPDETTIAEMLKGVGYSTAIFGKWHLGDNPKFLPLQQGFDEYYGIPYSNDMWPYHPQQGTWFDFGPLPLYDGNEIIDSLEDQSFLTTALTERGVDFIERNKDNPFFLYLAHPQPHVPLFVSEKYEGTSPRGKYGDVISEIDWSVGEILNALEENNLSENTLVIFTSDNGPWLSYGNHSGSALPFREGKGTTFEGGVKEPCVIYYPGTLKPKEIYTTMMTVDILPTLARITGATLPTKIIDGKDVWDVWTGETEECPHEAFYFYYRKNEFQAIRYKNWKMYYPHRYRTMNGQEPGKDGIPGEYKYIEIKDIELYDLSNDIAETTNVAGDHPEVVAEISKLGDAMRVRLGDSLHDMEEGTETRPIGRVEEVVPSEE